MERKWTAIRQNRSQVAELECSAILSIEYTAMEQLAAFNEKLRDTGVALWLAALNRQAFEDIGRAQLGRALGRKRMFFSLGQAVEAYTAQHIE